MKNETVQISFKVPLERKDAIYKYGQSQSPKLSLAAVCRKAIERELSHGTYKDEEETVLSNMKQALREVLTPSVERLASISSKNSIASATDMLLTSMLLYRLCDPNSRGKLDAFMEQARILGIKFVQLGKGSIEDYLKNSMEQLNEMWEE